MAGASVRARKLSEHFTWKEWAAVLAEEIKAAASSGESDDGSHYHERWLAALERLVAAKGKRLSASNCNKYSASCGSV